jgi:hypothetical protein
MSCTTSATCAATGYYVNGAGDAVPLTAGYGRVAPVVATYSAVPVSKTGATLNGTVEPNESPTEYFFEYGPTASYGSSTSPINVGDGTSAVEESKAVSGLEGGQEYHFRIVASNAAGTTKGEDQTFTTLKPPKATTEPATSVKSTQATLNGTVDPEGVATSYWFEYGTTTSYGTKIPATAIEVGSGTSGVAVSRTPTGLTPGTTYHYRVVAESEAGTADGADRSLTTGGGIPPVELEGSFTVESEEGISVGCQVSATIEPSPGHAGELSGLTASDAGEECETSGLLADEFDCHVTSLTAHTPFTISTAGEAFTIAGFEVVFGMGESCLLGPEVVVECYEPVSATPEDGSLFGELSLLADIRHECLSNIGMSTLKGTLEGGLGQL